MNELEQYNKNHLEAVQKKELHILCAIDDICKKHRIEYWLDGGTCLGAVRHGGFIPWDDDIDIAMRQEDIQRFVDAAEKELPDNLFMQTKQSDPSCRFPIFKVRDRNSFTVEYGDDFSRPYNKGLFVDIFPMVPYPSVSRSFCKKVTKGFCKSNAILQAQHVYSWRSVAELFFFGMKRFVYKSLWSMASLILSKDTYYSNRLSDNGYGIMHRRDSIFPTKPIVFDGRSFMGPANPDAYLKDLYGDYMTLPPEEKRNGHAVFFIDKLV